MATETANDVRQERIDYLKTWSPRRRAKTSTGETKSLLEMAWATKMVVNGKFSWAS